MLEHIRIQQDIVADEKYKFLFSVEEVNKLVLNGIPFRDAYKIVGQSIETGNFKANLNIQHTHEGSIGNLCTSNIQEKKASIWKLFSFEKADMAIAQLVT